MLIVPNLKDFETVIRDESIIEDETRSKEKEILLDALVDAVCLLEEESVGVFQNGLANGGGGESASKLREKVGDLVASKVLELGKPKLVKVILEC